MSHSHNKLRQLVKLAVALAIVIEWAAVGESRADETQYERALPSVALVMSPHPGSDQASIGTGALLEVRRKLILTAYHVVGERAAVVVFFPHTEAGKTISDPNYYLARRQELGIIGTVIAKDRGRDLGLIELERLPAGAKAMPLAASSAKPGETIFTIGNSGIAAGVLWRFMDGKVRQVYAGTKGLDTGVELIARFVEMTVPINEGDSGGPLINGAGELVAITCGGNQKQELVQYGIDVEEIQAMLGHHLPMNGRLDSVAQRERTKERSSRLSYGDADYVPGPPSDFAKFYRPRTEINGTQEPAARSPRPATRWSIPTDWSASRPAFGLDAPGARQIGGMRPSIWDEVYSGSPFTGSASRWRSSLERDITGTGNATARGQ